MAIPSLARVKREIVALRKAIEQCNDPIETRLLQAAEDTLRWSVEDTVGWLPPSKDCKELADILRKDLARQRTSAIV